MKKPATINILGYIGAVLLIIGILCPIVSYSAGRETIIMGYTLDVVAFVIIIAFLYAVGQYLNNKAILFITTLANGYFAGSVVLKYGKELLAQNLKVNAEAGIILLTLGMLFIIISTILVLAQKEVEKEEQKEIVKKATKDDGFPRLLGNHIIGFRDVPLHNACFMIVRNNQLEFYSKDVRGNDFNRLFAKKDIVSIEASMGVSFENDEGKEEASLAKQVTFLKEMIQRSPILIGSAYVEKFEEKRIRKLDHLQIYETTFVFLNNERKEEKVKIDSYEDNTEFVNSVKDIMHKKVTVKEEK